MPFQNFANAIILTGLLCSIPICSMAACDPDKHRMLDPLIGDWDEYQINETGRELIGRLSTRLIAGGCAIQQSFQSPDGSFSFSSLGYAESPETWFETYVMSIDRVVSYRWRSDGDELILDRVPAAQEPLRRLRIFDIRPDSYLVSTEESEDGGESWQQLDLVKTTRAVRSDTGC